MKSLQTRGQSHLELKLTQPTRASHGKIHKIHYFRRLSDFFTKVTCATVKHLSLTIFNNILLEETENHSLTRSLQAVTLLQKIL